MAQVSQDGEDFPEMKISPDSERLLVAALKLVARAEGTTIDHVITGLLAITTKDTDDSSGTGVESTKVDRIITALQTLDVDTKPTETDDASGMTDDTSTTRAHDPGDDAIVIARDHNIEDLHGSKPQEKNDKASTTRPHDPGDDAIVIARDHCIEELHGSLPQEENEDGYKLFERVVIKKYFEQTSEPPFFRTSKEQMEWWEPSAFGIVVGTTWKHVDVLQDGKLVSKRRKNSAVCKAFCEKRIT